MLEEKSNSIILRYNLKLSVVSGHSIILCYASVSPPSFFMRLFMLCVHCVCIFQMPSNFNV